VDQMPSAPIRNPPAPRCHPRTGRGRRRATDRDPPAAFRARRGRLAGEPGRGGRGRGWRARSWWSWPVGEATPASTMPRSLPVPLESTIRSVRIPASTTARCASRAWSASRPFDATVRNEPTRPTGGDRPRTRRSRFPTRWSAMATTGRRSRPRSPAPVRTARHCPSLVASVLARTSRSGRESSATSRSAARPSACGAAGRRRSSPRSPGQAVLVLDEEERVEPAGDERVDPARCSAVRASSRWRRSVSSRIASSGTSTPRSARAASNARNSLAGVLTSSAIQSWSSSRPASVIS
jgi:hypothetical protein